MPALPLCTPSLCVKPSPLSFANPALPTLDIPSMPPLSPLFATLTAHSQATENKATLSPFPATLTSHVKHKSFVCHSYEKQGGWGVPDIAFQIRPSTFNFQLSTLDIFRPPRVTSHLP